MKEENIHDFFADLAEELDAIYLDYTGSSGAMNLKLENGLRTKLGMLNGVILIAFLN